MKFLQPKEQFLSFSKGFSHFVIEMHLNNIQQRSDIWDTSGMRVFFSKNLRSNNISIGSFAQGYLEIPPGRPRHEHNMTCSSECTKQALKAPVNITHVFMHMHYLGMQSEVSSHAALFVFRFRNAEHVISRKNRRWLVCDMLKAI